MKVKFLAILLLIGVSQAQERLVAGGHVPDAPSMHKFWNTENKIDFSIFAGQLAADAITTQRGLNEGFREVNPLISPLVTRGAAGQATASAAKFRRWSGNRLFASCNAPLPCRARHATPYSRRRGCFGRTQYRAAEWTALVSHAVLRGAILSVHARCRKAPSDTAFSVLPAII